MSGSGSETTQASYKKPIQKPNVKRINIEVITEKTQGDSNDDSQEIEKCLLSLENLILIDNNLDSEKRKKAQQLLDSLKGVLLSQKSVNKFTWQLDMDETKRPLSPSTKSRHFSLFNSSDGLRGPKSAEKVKLGENRKRGSKNCYTPRSEQEKKSDKNDSRSIEPFPEQIKNQMDLMSNSLDDSEDELRFDSVKKKKDIDSIKLNNDPERCGAPDPIQMLTGNNTTMNIKSRYARRYHSDKDLTYGHKKVFMGSTEKI